jgi:hypothetical protein
MTVLTASIVIGLALTCAPEVDPAMIAGIATAESHLDPSAVHINIDGSRDVGLMQINGNCSPRYDGQLPGDVCGEYEAQNSKHGGAIGLCGAAE